MRASRLLLAPLAAAALFAAVPALAQVGDDSPTVDVQVDRPRPPANVPVRVTYTFSGTGNLGDVRPPDRFPARNLVLAGGPSTSTRITFINGELKKSVGFTYVFKPQGAGPAEIGETTWTVGGKSVKAGPYALEVGPAVPGPGPGPGFREPDPFDDPIFGRPSGAPPLGTQRRAAATRPVEPVVLLAVSAEQASAYVGEEVVVHFELITQADVTGLEYVEAPKFPGFWAEDLERPDRPTGRRDTYDGQPVLRFTLLKKAVAGLAPGSLTIPPATVRLALRGGVDFFSDPFSFVRPQVVERSTQPLTIKVLPIPGNPDFKGPVGTFDISASVDRKSVGAGDAVTLKVRLTGSGNLRTATEAPRIDVPGARVYAPTSKSNSARTGGKLTSTADWSYVIVPQAPGSLVIPPVSLDVFDPAQKRTVTRSTAPVTIQVEAAAPAPGTEVASAAGTPPGTAAPPASPGAAFTLPAADEPATPAAEGAPPKPAGTAGGAPALDLSRRTVTLPLWLIVAIPVAVVLAASAAVAASRLRRGSRAHRSALVPEPGETKERAASRLDRAVRGVIAARWGIPETTPTTALLERLEASAVPSDTREAVASLLEDLDFLRFAPQLGDYADRIAEAREKARRLLDRIG